MCKAVMEIKNEGVLEGRKEGRAERDIDFANAIKNLMTNGNMTFDEACKMLGINSEDSKRYKALM